jgi:hypothetical protein
MRVIGKFKIKIAKEEITRRHIIFIRRENYVREDL